MFGLARRSVLVVCVLALAAGCGGGAGVPSKSALRGRLTLDKKTLGAGNVTVYSGGSKVAEAPINQDGSFEFYNLSSGDYQLTVTDTEAGNPYFKGVKLPSRYADPAKSGLTVNVAAGENSREFDLKAN
jgi:hypothetical protein